MITSEVMRRTGDGKWYTEDGLPLRLLVPLGHGVCAVKLNRYFTITSERIQLSLHRARSEAGPKSILVEHFAENQFLLDETDDIVWALPMMALWFMAHVGHCGRAWICVWELS